MYASKLSKFLSLLILTVFIMSGILISEARAISTEWKDSSDSHVKVRLLGSYYRDNDGNSNKLLLGAQFKIAEGWKVYAPDGNGFGLPPSFDFSKSSDIISSKTIWPLPISVYDFVDGKPVEYYIYKDEVIIPVDVDTRNADGISLNIKLTYGICKTICVPSITDFVLEIPNEPYDIETLKLIKEYDENDIVKLNLEKLERFNKTGKEDWPSFVKEKFLDATGKADLPITNQKLSRDPIDNAGPIKGNLFIVFLIAMLGGLILNIMPCVLPVLSIKIFSIMKEGKAKHSEARTAFLSSAIGIIFSFIVLSIVVSGFKIAGHSVGWGFQFQNLYFMIFLIMAMGIFASNLFGFFEINLGAKINTLFSQKASKSNVKKNTIIASNFLSGAFAVLIATPCSAPFLGTAISFSLSRGVLEIILIFIAMGIGMATPYIILILFPKLSDKLPKPGEWMIKIKKALGLLLLLTALWLIYVIHSMIGFRYSLYLLIILLLSIIQFAITKKIFPYKKIRGKISLVLFVVLSALALVIPAKVNQQLREPILFIDNSGEHEDPWIEFNREAIPELVKMGKTVVVDITADWCVTCKTNKALVLNRKEVIDKLSEKDIIAMRATMNQTNQELLDYMKTMGRYAIPFNAVYGPNAPDGLLVPELLTKNRLLETIAEVSKAPASK